MNTKHLCQQKKQQQQISFHTHTHKSNLKQKKSKNNKLTIHSKNQQQKNIVKISAWKSVLLEMLGKILSASCEAIFNKFFHGPENTKFGNVLPIFFGGPIGSYLPSLGSCAGVMFALRKQSSSLGAT